MDLSTGKIGIAPTDQIKEIFVNFKEQIEFKSRNVEFGEGEVLYNDKSFTEEIIGSKLQSEKWVLSPTYMGMKVIRLRVERIPPEFEREWLLAAVINDLDKEVLQVSKLTIYNGSVMNWKYIY